MEQDFFSGWPVNIYFRFSSYLEMIFAKQETMGKAIVKLYIATYAEEEHVVEVPCEKDEVEEIIKARAWKILKEQEGGTIPYGHRTATILKREE
jgi:hypothetical protein